jgi:hypothetical protein
MSIEKKSLISTLQSTKKANVAKESGLGDASKSSPTKSPAGKRLTVRHSAAAKRPASKAAASKNAAAKRPATKMTAVKN